MAGEARCAPHRRGRARSTPSSTAPRPSSRTPASSRSTRWWSTPAAGARSGPSRSATSRPARPPPRRAIAALRGVQGLRVDLTTADPQVVAHLAAAGVPLVATGTHPALGPTLTQALSGEPDLDDALAREEHSVTTRRAALLEHSTVAWRARLAARAGVRHVAQPAGQRPADHDAPAPARLRAAPARPPARRRLRARARHPRLGGRRGAGPRGPARSRRRARPAQPGHLLRRRAQRGVRGGRPATCCSRSTTTTGTARTRSSTCSSPAATAAPTWSGMPSEFVHLAELGITTRRNHPTEIFNRFVAGGTIMADRDVVRSVGGFRPVRRFVDAQLLSGIEAAGGRIYRTHGLGYVLRRLASGQHTWQVGGRLLPQGGHRGPGVDRLPRQPRARGRRAGPAMTQPVSARRDQPVVRRNEWDVLTPPAIGAWTPTRTVTVVVPAYNSHRTLPHVLAGLAAQTYPAHLMEVVVSDDGSTPPVVLPEVVPDHTRVVRVEEGWGCAGACEVAGPGERGRAPLLRRRRHAAVARPPRGPAALAARGRLRRGAPAPSASSTPSGCWRRTRRPPATQVASRRGRDPLGLGHRRAAQVGRGDVAAYRRPHPRRPARLPLLRRRDLRAVPRPARRGRRLGHDAAPRRGHGARPPPRRGRRTARPRARREVLAPRPLARHGAPRAGQPLQRRLPRQPGPRR